MTGRELAAWRYRHGYTQATLAEALGYNSDRHVRQWESGAVEIPQVVEIALKQLETEK
jgi:transcriptional regulator with XRE-family HTH domain